MPATIIESCHLEEAKWDLIQFARMTIRTLIKKDWEIMTLVLMCIVQVYRFVSVPLCQFLLTSVQSLRLSHRAFNAANAVKLNVNLTQTI